MHPERAYRRPPSVTPVTSPAPRCSRCGGVMQAHQMSAAPGGLRFRAGAPVWRRPLLPTWRCGTCGLQQPRIEDD